MRFREFWPRYLQAHRLPETRSLHYVATLLGAASVVEAIATGEALIGVAGIVGAYAIAVSAHWLVEGNQPLIGVSPFWGAVADLRMCWLAATGQLADEFARHGVAIPSSPAASLRRNSRTSGFSIAIALASVVGLLAALGDLDDLAAVASAPAFPLLQTGMPILLFVMALIAACASLSGGGLAIAAPARPSAAPVRDSQRRASAILFGLGIAGFAAAELAENGAGFAPRLFVGGMAFASLAIAGIALILRRR